MAPLRQFYTVADEIPEPLRDFYIEKESKWVIDTDPPTEDVSGLKTALETERRLRRDVERRETDLKVKFEGIDPDEVRTLRERVKGLDEAEIYDKHGIDALVTKRTETMKADHQRIVDAKEREIEQLRTQASDYDRRWRQDRIKTALLDAVTKAGVYERAVEDAVQRGLMVFTDLDDSGNVVARKGEDLLYGKDGINPLSPSEWITGLKSSGQAPHLWPPSSGGGAPAHHGSNGAGVDWSKLPPAERLTKYRELQAAGRA
jgi:hypothetical protein